MKRLLTWLSRRRFPYEPLIIVEIYKSHLLHNLHEFQKIAPESKVAPVLKSNAYGHGLFEIAQILQKENKVNKDSIPFLIVDSYFETLALRSARIKTPLLIIGYTRPETIIHSKLAHVSFTVTSLETLKIISHSKKNISIHLKIDTGMHRQGIMFDQLDEAIKIIKNSQTINLEGIATHLSDADSPDDTFTNTQINQWNDCVQKFKKEFPTLKWFHASATYGHNYSKKIRSNISRLGIGLYGLADKLHNQPNLILKPVLEMKTIVSDIKKLQPGDHVGYNNTFTAQHDLTMATIPAGYFEGINRRLSNTGELLVGPKRTACNIIGRVSMNITCLDVSKVSNIKINDPVVIISCKPNDPNSIAAIVKKSEGTIPYEIVTRIPAHLKRVVV